MIVSNRAPIGKCLRCVDDYDVILVTSQSSKSSHSETRTRINNPCGTLIHTHYRRTLFKRISSFGLEFWEKHLARPHYDRKSTLFTRSAIATLCFAAYNRLARIGDVKLSRLNKVSFESSDRCCGGAPYPREAGRVGRLKLSSARARLPTCFFLSSLRRQFKNTAGKRQRPGNVKNRKILGKSVMTEKVLVSCNGFKT